MTRDPKKLTIHPAVAFLPRLAADAPERATLRESIATLGILQDLLVTEAGLVPDGRHRLEIALELDLPEVPVRIVSEEEALEIALATLMARRHYTAGARAYLAMPLVSETANSNKVSRVPGRNRTECGFAEWAAKLGVGLRTLEQASELFSVLAEKPDVRERIEAPLFAGEWGLGKCLQVAGMAGHEGLEPESENQQDRSDRARQLWAGLTKTMRVRVDLWTRLMPKDRKAVLDDFALVCAEMPADLQKGLSRMLKRAQKKQTAA